MKQKTFTTIMVLVFAACFVSAQELSVEPNTNIKVLSGTTLKVSAGDLVLKSDATGDATLIAFGTVAGDSAIVQRYLPGTATSEIPAWHFISSPVNGMAITDSDWEPGDDDDFYLWYEPSPGTWVNYKNTTVSPTFTGINPGDSLVTGRGYIVNYLGSNPTYNFGSSGLNTGNINITLDKISTKDWDWTAGWNLIGNPYASGLDWSAVSKTNLTEIYAHIYDPNKSGGEGYEAVNGTIASGQGFFVQAVSDEAVIALQPSQQVHTTTQTFLKQGADKLVLRLTGGQYYDETKILLNEASTPEHDFYDASKFFSFNPQVPQLYSLAPDGWQLAINSIDAISETTVIPLSIKVQGSSEMTIKLTEKEGVFEGPTIILHDLLTNIQHELNKVPGYNFIANEEDDPNRFLLKFGAVGIDELPGSAMLHAYMQDNLLYILNPDAPNARVELYNIKGQLILRKEIGRGLQSMSLNVETGIYLVLLRTDETVATRKLFIP